MVLDAPAADAQSTLSPRPVLPVRLDVVARLLKGLNREQRRAVTHRDGPQLVLAGPGTGKTEVITRRVAWLIATRRAMPREILALTFTDAAAQEMQARVDLLVPYGQADAAINTFHAFGDRLIREHAFDLGLPGDVRLINRAEAIVLLRDHMLELGLSRYLPLGNPTRFLGALADLFGRAKDEGVGPAQLSAYARSRAADAVDEVDHDAAAALAEQAAAYDRYQALMAERGLIDHGDQLALPVRLLRDRPAVGRSVRQGFRYVLVDEFQDMNRAQLELLQALTPEGRSVTVVGDPNQAIYEFRGASGDNDRSFARTHPDLTRVVLRRNYRSRRPILDAAMRLISHGPGWEAQRAQAQPVAARRALRSAGVRLHEYQTADEEADEVARRIAERVAAGEAARDFAVLARSNSEVEQVARSLAMRGVRTRTHSPADFFAQPQVRPLVALLRFAADPAQTLEVYVVATAWPYQLSGPALTNLLTDARRTHRSLWDVLCAMVDGGLPTTTTGFYDRARRLVADLRAALDMVHERSSGELLYDHLRRSGRLARLAAEGNAGEARAVARLFDIVRARSNLIADPRAGSLMPHLDQLIEAQEDVADDGPPEDDAVAVLTAHRAKGLEFKVVFLVGLAEGRFPARTRPPALHVPWAEVRGESAVEMDEERLQQERRLCFVAMTRARDELWLSTHLAAAGQRSRRRPSPFIAEALDLPTAHVSSPRDPVERIAVRAIPAQAAPEGAPRDARQRVAGISFSQVEEYIDCPERYRLRQVVGLPTPAHHALSYGRAMHSAVAAFHLRAAAGEMMTEAQLIESYKGAWTPEGFLSRGHEEARFEAGRRALLAFRQEQTDRPAPVVAVERPFEFALGQTRIRGRMDRVDREADGAVIVDYKSSDVRDRRTANKKARDSLQLQVYALAWQAQRGELPRAMRLHFLESGVTGETTPDGARLERAREHVDTAIEGISRGEFAPRPNPVACGYCPFRQVCPSSAA